MNINIKAVAAVTVAALVSATAVSASHGRGGAVVPTVDANGLLTIDLISYWDPTGINEPSSISFSVSGVGSTSGTKSFSDTTSDPSREEHIYTATQQLSGAGLYTISWGTCCLTGGIRNIGEDDFGTTSTIYWDGQSASAPILFDLENIQQQVIRGQAYSDNLDAIAGPGLTLTYGDSTSSEDTSGVNPPGYVLDGTGTISIDAANTANYLDNSQNPNGGADYLFSGKMTAEDGAGQERGSIEYFWLFDAVEDDGSINRAPTVQDIVVNAIVGDTIIETVTATDPDGDTVTLSFDNFFGGGVTTADATFDPSSGLFTFDSTGFGAGIYIATIEGTDGFLTDIGSITINLTTGGGTNVVPLPATGLMLFGGLAGLAALRRKRKAA